MIDRRQFLANSRRSRNALVLVAPRRFHEQREHHIHIWLGSACHVDAWDPRIKGDPRKKRTSVPGAINASVPGLQVYEHLSNCW